jgi:hypothetical protein
MFKLMLSALALMLLVIGAASGVDHSGSNNYGSDMSFVSGHVGKDMPGGDDGSRMFDHHGQSDGFSDRTHNYGSNFNHYDWLSPGAVYWYPASYNYFYSPYPIYYTTPMTYHYSYNPVVYNPDPWWAANVYGFGTTTYYSSSWSYHNGGFFFGI